MLHYVQSSPGVHAVSATPFEYEERYPVHDLDKVSHLLKAAEFEQTAAEIQTDHWFIPRDIMSPEQQSHWFDYEHGYALRIREESGSDGSKTVITTKRLLTDGDHSAMTNNESVLSVQGMAHVLSFVGEEFNDVQAKLTTYTGDALSFDQAKQLIESAGRKEYIVLEKQRRTFRNPAFADVVVDLDSIPALQNSGLGFWSSVEIEYTGGGSPEAARLRVGKVSGLLGYTREEILSKALPGLAITYLATF